MHPLELYMAESGKSVDDIAERAKKSKNTIYKYLQGTRAPRRQDYLLLSKATGGSVTVKDLINYYQAPALTNLTAPVTDSSPHL